MKFWWSVKINDSGHCAKLRVKYIKTVAIINDFHSERAYCRREPNSLIWIKKIIKKIQLGLIRKNDNESLFSVNKNSNLIEYDLRSRPVYSTNEANLLNLNWNRNISLKYIVFLQNSSKTSLFSNYLPTHYQRNFHFAFSPKYYKYTFERDDTEF